MRLSIKAASPCSVFLALVAFLLSAPPEVGAGETIVDSANGFTLTLPDGFKPNQTLVGKVPDTIHAFARDDAKGDEPGIILLLEQMRGTIGRERLKDELLPPDFEGRIFTTHWRGFEVDAIEVRERLGEVATITYNVQIPLKRAAIQVKLFGPASREEELKRLLAEILGGLHGESNWLPSAFTAPAITESKDYGIILSVVAIVFVLTGLVGLWLISKKAPEGIVIGIAALIYGAALMLGELREREIVLLRGVMKMLGVAGLILGIANYASNAKARKRDAARKRRRRPTSTDAGESRDH